MAFPLRGKMPFQVIYLIRTLSVSLILDTSFGDHVTITLMRCRLKNTCLITHRLDNWTYRSDPRCNLVVWLSACIHKWAWRGPLFFLGLDFLKSVRL